MHRTTVVHIRQPHDVKVCRTKTGKIPPPPQGGCFGNPFILWDTEDDQERAKVIAQYQTYFLRRIDEDDNFRSAVLKLKGKRLACFCAPKPCHGDVIADWVDNHG